MSFKADILNAFSGLCQAFTAIGNETFHVLMPLYAGGCEQRGRGTTPFVIKLKMILSFQSNFQVGAGPLGIAAPLADGDTCLYWLRVAGYKVLVRVAGRSV
jgi:hypothetical protein